MVTLAVAATGPATAKARLPTRAAPMRMDKGFFN
jgi:hypothetical protein